MTNLSDATPAGDEYLVLPVSIASTPARTTCGRDGKPGWPISRWTTSASALQRRRGGEHRVRALVLEPGDAIGGGGGRGGTGGAASGLPEAPARAAQRGRGATPGRPGAGDETRREDGGDAARTASGGMTHRRRAVEECDDARVGRSMPRCSRRSRVLVPYSKLYMIR